ncbi:ABC transporter ATP-binding protein [Salinibacterium sp. NK8237]|uniref:ABC transporter ATP-binding protein n=1 Tax=Salinibacterium sp. NK8237 TaxID=2792038 RepID=UPI0018CDABF0|nr:ABC transporter ATP-binding protein [Salinibacterium sp. NK8237]MBH0130113.1 ABC transporter ATP-binding protein [Salinibacterium sp. NK8237]
MTPADTHPADTPQRPPHELRADNVTLNYGGRDIVSNVSVTIPDGTVTVIVGANACGKSTLLRGLSRLLRPASGHVMLDGRDIHSMASKEVAQVVGILPQSPIAPEGITVRDLVARGRYPHQGWFQQWSAADEAAVEHALEATDTAQLASRRIEELSGGQRQRVWIAMALSQDPDILLLDEPTTFLDVRHQLDALDVLATLNRERGTTIVMVLHELNLAARYADHMILMGEGQIIAEGTPAEVVTAERMREAFGLEAQIMADPVSGSPMVIPLGRRPGR